MISYLPEVMIIMKKIVSISLFFMVVLMLFCGAAISAKMTIQVFTAPKNVKIDGVFLTALKDFEYDISKGTQVVSGSDDEVIMMYDGTVIEGTMTLSGLSELLDERLKSGRAFNIEYIEAEEEGSDMRRKYFSGCKVVKSYFSYDEPDEVLAKYVFRAMEVK